MSIDKIYNIRKDVLNIPINTWDKINKDFKDNIITLTVNEALTKYKLISGNSGKFNDEEKEFFEEEYNELRKRNTEILK